MDDKRLLAKFNKHWAEWQARSSDALCMLDRDGYTDLVRNIAQQFWCIGRFEVIEEMIHAADKLGLGSTPHPGTQRAGGASADSSAAIDRQLASGLRDAVGGASALPPADKRN